MSSFFAFLVGAGASAGAGAGAGAGASAGAVLRPTERETGAVACIAGSALHMASEFQMKLNHDFNVFISSDPLLVENLRSPKALAEQIVDLTSYNELLDLFIHRKCLECPSDPREMTVELNIFLTKQYLMLQGWGLKEEHLQLLMTSRRCLEIFNEYTLKSGVRVVKHTIGCFGDFFVNYFEVPDFILPTDPLINSEQLELVKFVRQIFNTGVSPLLNNSRNLTKFKEGSVLIICLAMLTKNIKLERLGTLAVNIVNVINRAEISHSTRRLVRDFSESLMRLRRQADNFEGTHLILFQSLAQMGDGIDRIETKAEQEAEIKGDSIEAERKVQSAQVPRPKSLRIAHQVLYLVLIHFRSLQSCKRSEDTERRERLSIKSSLRRGKKEIDACVTPKALLGIDTTPVTQACNMRQLVAVFGELTRVRPKIGSLNQAPLTEQQKFTALLHGHNSYKQFLQRFHEKIKKQHEEIQKLAALRNAPSEDVGISAVTLTDKMSEEISELNKSLLIYFGDKILVEKAISSIKAALKSTERLDEIMKLNLITLKEHERKMTGLIAWESHLTVQKYFSKDESSALESVKGRASEVESKERKETPPESDDFEEVPSDSDDDYDNCLVTEEPSLPAGDDDCVVVEKEESVSSPTGDDDCVVKKTTALPAIELQAPIAVAFRSSSSSSPPS